MKIQTLQKFIFYSGIFLFLSGSCQEKEPVNRFPLADQYNIDEKQLISAFEDMKDVEGALSLIVCRNGTIVAEEYFYYNDYGPDSIKNVMSVTKSFTGVLVGLAIDQGFIESVNDPISKYLDGLVTFPDETKANITVDQLLKMSFGHSWNGTSMNSLYDEWISSEDQLQYIIDLPLVDSPGTVFNYSDGASHLLSVIISESTGQNTLDFAKKNLFEPLEIEKFEWAADDRGYPIGAAGLRIIPSDMVKFGNLILNKGQYNGEQVIPETWINIMTETKIFTDNDVPFGPEYGYQIWIGSSQGHKHIFAMGWGGQFIFIVPDQDLVVTATCWTSGLDFPQAGQHWSSIINIIVERIFPAVHN